MKKLAIITYKGDAVNPSPLLILNGSDLDFRCLRKNRSSFSFKPLPFGAGAFSFGALTFPLNANHCRLLGFMNHSRFPFEKRKEAHHGRG